MHRPPNARGLRGAEPRYAPEPSPPRRLLAALALALALAIPTAACNPSGAQPPQTPAGAEGKVVPVNVRDQDFSASLFSLLRDGTPSPQRNNLLAGVVRRQLAHAASRLAAGKAERASRSVLGAMYLVRIGEGRAEMIDATGERALAGATEWVSLRGDEGRAQALLQMRAAALPKGSPARAEIEQHLAALERWMKDTRTGGPLARIGAEQRALVSRALVDGRRESLDRAGAALGAWIDRAVELSLSFRTSGERPDRDEAIEAEQALQSGGAMLAALYLRYGDARGALAQIDRSGARRVIPPGLYDRIQAAATGEDAVPWQSLAMAFGRFAHGDGGEEERADESGLGRDLLEGAVWGTALEAFRRDPADPETAALLADMLIRLGMSEAAPLVLAQAIGERPGPQALAGAVGIVLQAMSTDAGIDDLDAVRRTYVAAAPILALADQASKGRGPLSARPRFLMASVELRSGNLPAALPLLRAATQAEPTVGGLALLATAERQSGDSAAAQATVRRALAAPDAAQSLAEVADAHRLAFDLHREANAAGPAKQSLDAALTAALAARQRARGAGEMARAERVLGRVLDGYGDAKAAARAHERALSLAAEERPLLGITMLDAVGHALVRGDLTAARKALRQGIEENAEVEDLAYGGLWVMLLERQLRVPTDGTAEMALTPASKSSSWVGRLAAWASGKLSDADLGTAAQSASQRVEAQFYTSMARKAAGDAGAVEGLRAVSRSPVIDLLEVHLAREMLAPRVKAELPQNVKLPP